MKHAFVLIESASMDDVVAVLIDGGLQPLERLFGDRVDGRVPVLFFGDILPDGCESGLPIVDVTFRKETYGRQSITRIGEIKLTGRSIYDLVRDEFEPRSGLQRMAA